MSKAAAFLRNTIRQQGPVDLGTFMGVAVTHYYQTRDPFGVDGDFTTAPEISQMFGEILGAWVADCWDKLGCPDPFILLECGPGRGTLMADMLRTAKNMPGFINAMNLYLMETSPVLMERQGQALKEYNPKWLEGGDLVRELPSMPSIIIGNEFLDALPIRQLVKHANGWHEKMVALDGDDFVFGLAPASDNLLQFIPRDILDAANDVVFEVSPSRYHFVQNIASFLQQNHGAALMIDYGHSVSAPGDTLQALKAHKFISVLENVGDADITSHVDFSAVIRVAEDVSIATFGPVEQGFFLQRLGIIQRSEVLKNKATKAQQNEIDMALKRLCDPDEMGRLFKVVALCHDHTIIPAGF